MLWKFDFRISLRLKLVVIFFHIALQRGLSFVVLHHQVVVKGDVCIRPAGTGHIKLLMIVLGKRRLSWGISFELWITLFSGIFSHNAIGCIHFAVCRLDLLDFEAMVLDRFGVWTHCDSSRDILVKQGLQDAWSRSLMIAYLFEWAFSLDKAELCLSRIQNRQRMLFGLVIVCINIHGWLAIALFQATLRLRLFDHAIAVISLHTT